MDEHQHHQDLMQSLSQEYSDILSNSEQGVYIYLDDAHKICNANFASLLGYSSEKEWTMIDSPFPDAFVAEESQEALISSFQDAMEKNVGSTQSVVWKKKDGSTIESTVILVPIAHQGHTFALHFVSGKV
ncbi:MAG: PAS domain-containing protein [Candidatus Levybacteria bacterium]|nr:PAS domain-containing protein [Candidatus Levybacteria bacterium]